LTILLSTIEANLDSTISAPRRNAEELASFVHRPIFKHVLFATPDGIDFNYSTSVVALERVINQLDIEDDPYVKSLRANLQRLPPGSERTRVDQLLSKTISNDKTYTREGLKDFLLSAQDICKDIGHWAADWYVAKVLEHVKVASSAFQPFPTELKNRERSYLLSILNQLVVSPVSDDYQDIMNGSTDKVRVLVECLVAEKASVEAQNEAFSGLVFVTRRDAVLALAEVLSRHPQTKELFVIGRLLGTSENRFRRQTFLDITRSLFRQPQEETLNDFKNGDKNLVISTSVAEEGIDIQSCCNVIRWDPPQNMVSWAQSRGRARRQRSTFVVMFPDDGSRDDDVKNWMKLEREMVSLYNSAERELQLELTRFSSDNDSGEDEDEEDGPKLHVESTG
jgi:endoribonuclease Dicer